MRIPVSHRVRRAGLCLLTSWVLGIQGCGPKEVPPATPPAPAAAAKPGAAPAIVPTPGTAAPAPAAKPSTSVAAQTTASPSPTAASPAAVPAPAPVAMVPAPAPAPEAKPAAHAPAPVPAASPLADPGGEVAVKPTKAGLTKVGSNACKLCHRVQFASWSETAHAKRNPPLDCEACHGAGSEYKAMAMMKDSAKASAAGLVRPGAPFCATCHTRGWSDGMLKKAHAHKG